MEEQEPPKAAKSSSGYGSSAQQKAEEPKRTKRRRQPVPDERKDGRYWERRRKNNVAARRSRESRRLKQEQDLLKAEQAIQENIRLRAEVDVLKSEICSLRRLLKDANTTLSLWIKARQATEPVHQLPPNLRDKNGPLSFVNFPMWMCVYIDVQCMLALNASHCTTFISDVCIFVTCGRARILVTPSKYKISRWMMWCDVMWCNAALVCRLAVPQGQIVTFSH